MSDHVFSLDELAVLVRDRGVSAVVEMTGGGVATLLAGDVVAGPGWFDGPGYTVAMASFDEFCIGFDETCDYVSTPESLDLLADRVVEWTRRV